jgi:hypothetical protein
MVPVRVATLIVLVIVACAPDPAEQPDDPLPTGASAKTAYMHVQAATCGERFCNFTLSDIRRGPAFPPVNDTFAALTPSTVEERLNETPFVILVSYTEVDAFQDPRTAYRVRRIEE